MQYIAKNILIKFEANLLYSLQNWAVYLALNASEYSESQNVCFIVRRHFDIMQ